MVINSKLLVRENPRAMTYLSGPGYFGYYNTDLEDIRSGATVLLIRQQWSIGRILYLYSFGKYRNQPRIFTGI